MLAKDAPWWAGEWGNLPHAAGDNRPAYNNGQPTGANASNWKQYQPSQYPTQQGGQQASPSKAPDMSAYGPGVGGFQAYSGPRTPPKGARQNDLSGQVPSNQIWGQAYNQASKQYGGNAQAQSWTMPGSYTSQNYNPATGQYSQPTGGQSWDGNMAYNAMDQRPGPIQASATGVGGNPMQWQDAMTQREAFVGNLSQRLGQYSGGQLTGPVTFDPNQLLSQANDQLANGTFYNPFSQNPDIQRAMGNANQYMQGTQWQNPFGNAPEANNPRPSFDQQSYDPNNPSAWPNYLGPQRINPATGMASHDPSVLLSPPVRPRPYVSPTTGYDIGIRRTPTADDQPLTGTPSRRFDPSKGFGGQWVWDNPEEGRRFEEQAGVARPGAAQPKQAPSQGTTYDPSKPQDPLPPVVDPIQRELDDKKKAAEYRAKNNIKLPRAEMSQEDLYRKHPNLRPKPDRTNMIPFTDYDPVTGETFTKATPAELAERRMSEQEQAALNDLRSSGRATPANMAGVRSYFKDLRQAKQNPGPSGGRTSPPAASPKGGAKPAPQQRGTYTRPTYAYRAR